MKLSVIIPVYNSAVFISETFRELVDYLEKLGGRIRAPVRR